MCLYRSQPNGAKLRILGHASDTRDAHVLVIVLLDRVHHLAQRGAPWRFATDVVAIYQVKAVRMHQLAPCAQACKPAAGRRSANQQYTHTELAAAPGRVCYISESLPQFVVTLRALIPTQSMASCTALTAAPMSARIPRTHALRAPRRPENSCRRVVAYAGEPVLEVKDLRATIRSNESEVLKGVNLTIKRGEVTAIMGKNGCGKSTLSKVLVGHPDYEITGGTATYKGENLLDMEPEERARAGLFLSFQSPIEVPGVNNVDFLRMAANARRKSLGEPELEPLEFYMHVQPKLEAMKMDPTFLNRNVNEGFSGGEKKRNEMLQLAVLDPDVAILDEIDSGLDVDALRDVSNAVNGLRSPEKALVLITHYKRLLEYIEPDVVHVMADGVITKTGGMEIVEQLEAGGYATVA
eukprot:jgi/Ulvmu1/6531/UM003_0164.1